MNPDWGSYITNGTDMRWIDDTYTYGGMSPVQARELSEFELKQIQDKLLLAELKTTRTTSTLQTSTERTAVLRSAVIGELDRLLTELSAPSETPGTDEYEDGFNACLALVEEFRDELRRQEQQ